MKKIYIYFIALSAVNYFRGSFLIGLAWASTIGSENVTKTGVVFLISSTLGFLLNPFSGVLTDGKKRSNLIYIAQILNIFSCATLIYLITKQHYDLSILIIAIVLNSLASSLLSGSMDAILQNLSTQQERRKMGSLASVIRQISLIVSAGGMGLTIEILGFKYALYGLIVVSMTIVVLIYMLKLNEKAINKVTLQDFMLKLKEGAYHIATTKTLLFLFLGTILAFAFGQMINVLLAPFINLERGLPSGVYGLMDSLWSIGGVVSSIVAYKLSIKGIIKIALIISFLAMSICMMLFYVQPYLIVCMIAITIAGAGFSVIKVILDGILLEICPDQIIGRVRANIQSGISAGGCLIFLSVTLLGSLPPSLLFMILGVSMLLLSIILLWKFRFISLAKNQE